MIPTFSLFEPISFPLLSLISPSLSSPFNSPSLRELFQLVHGYWSPLGNWGVLFFIFKLYCMAKTKTPSSSSSSSYSSLSPIDTSTKSNPFLLFLSLIFIFLLLARPTDQIRHSNRVSEPVSQILAASAASSSSSTTTSSFQPKTAQHGKKTVPSKEFESSEHEVPSGPNPISNRWACRNIISIGIVTYGSTWWEVNY